MRKEIIDCLHKGLYQTPETLRNRINAKFSIWYNTDSISRDLRKLKALGKVESKEFPNKNNNKMGRKTHNKWKLKER